ncbi:MAG: NAD(P)H-quinone oxidoreductase [Proteobacteria bacterium]|nr:NAD(P)H-quinone oxidoreductase [Pseudomonadota bacterium]
MKAIAVEGGRGGPEALVLVETARPEPGPGQILIRVRVAGVNRPDILQRMGLYPPPPGAPETLGLEVAGEVAGLGEGAPRWKVGDCVTALLGGGGYAEWAVVDARHALPIPEGLSFEAAAGLPETVFTVFANVFERGGLKAGETLMLHGATSGIGVTAIQMAKAAGARVIATSRGTAKAEQARGLGADISLDSTAGDWVEAVKAAGGADVILDMVGGDFTAKNLECLKLDGRLVLIAFQAGSMANVDLRRIQTQRLTVTGSTLRNRPADEKARLAAAVEQTVWPWLAAGKLKTVIDHTFPLARAADAHRRLEDGAHFGKIILLT